MNPSTDDWRERTAFEDSPRESACAFSFGTYGYVACHKKDYKKSCPRISIDELDSIKIEYEIQKFQ